MLSCWVRGVEPDLKPGDVRHRIDIPPRRVRSDAEEMGAGLGVRSRECRDVLRGRAALGMRAGFLVTVRAAPPESRTAPAFARSRDL